MEPGNPFAGGMFRTPHYGPGMSPAMMQDPMSMLMLLFGMPLIQQQLGGRDKFLPHLTPNQALMDQFMGAQYQRASLAASLEMSREGQASVSNRIAGLMSMATGEPVTQLNREQSDNIAGMINHPVIKMMLGQMLGPENLEAVMFGRKGDPAALASAVARTGFFRRDPLGGERMSGESMAAFSKGIHANLYGEGADIDAMHGFMAGQAGQMFDHLFRQGTLPQSIGALTPAERVRAVADNTRRDDATLNRLAEEMGRKELMQSRDLFNGRRFEETTAQEQAKILEERLPQFRTRVDEEFQRIDEFRNNDERFRSPQERDDAAREIEQLGGFGAAARNADASKVANKIKQFSGSVAALREIFGDNGNPNAPIPALLAALDQLSQGSMMQLSPGKVESTLRQMRLAARDAGIGMEQMMGISAEVGAYGDTLGIARPIAMQNTLNAMLMTGAMREAGAFERPIFGRMTQPEATREAALRMTSGDASGVGRTLAAVARAVAENPERYKGTEIEQLAAAYRSGSETYTFNGKTVNLAELAGQGGSQAIAEKFTAPENRGDMSTLRMFSIDQATQEYMTPGYGFLAQPHQMQRDIANAIISPEISDQLDLEEYTKMAQRFGVAPEDAERERYAFSKMFANDISGVIIEETANMSTAERLDYLQTRMPELAVQFFKDRGFNDADAQARADAVLPMIMGTTPEEARDFLGRISSGADAFVQAGTGRTMAANLQLASPAARANLIRNQIRTKAKAERYAAVSRGNESTVLQRIFEEAERVGQGEEFDFSRIANTLNVAGIRDAYSGELAGGFEQYYSQRRALTVSEADVEQLVQKAQAGGAAGDQAVAELRSMADLAADTEIVGAGQIAQTLEGKSDKEIDALYKKHVGGTATDKTTRIRELSHTAGVAEVAGVLDPDKNQIVQGQLYALGYKGVGMAKGGTVSEADVEQLVQRAQAGGVDGDQAVAALRSMSDIAADTEIVGAGQIAQTLEGKSDKEIEALYNKHVGGAATDKATRIRELSHSAGVAEVAGVLDPDKNQIVQGQLYALGYKGVGMAKGGTIEERRANRDRMRRLDDYAQALSAGDDAGFVQSTAEALATDVAQDQNMTDAQAQSLREKYVKAIEGDDTALAELGKTITTDQLEQVKGLRASRDLYKKDKITLRDEQLGADYGAAEAAVKGVEVAEKSREVAQKNKEMAQRAAEAAGAPVEQDGGFSLMKPWTWFGGEEAQQQSDKPSRPAAKPAAAKPAADSQKTDTAQISATDVQLAADSVTVIAQERGEGGLASKTLRPEDIPLAEQKDTRRRGLAEDSGSASRRADEAAQLAANVGRSITPVASMRPPGSGGEMTISGTLALSNLHKGVLEVTGERPLETPDGAPVMNAHQYG